jgi:hypothetical protein
MPRRRRSRTEQRAADILAERRANHRARTAIHESDTVGDPPPF